MRVLFSTYPTSFAVPGGGEQQILNTKRYLQKLGVCIENFDIWTTVDHNKYDLLHIFSVCNSSEFYVDWAIRNKIPYVVSPILWPNEFYTDDEAHRLRHIFNNATFILPNSNAEKDRIIDILRISDKGQFVTILNGIESGKFLSINRNLDLIKLNTVLSIANIDRRKNHLLLANACKKTNKKLVLAGRIRDVDYFEEIFRKFSDHVIYVGPVANGSIEHLLLLEQSGLFALPSLCETPGIAALEAAASGIPVILTEVGAGKEYFGSHAKFCNPNSIDSIIEAIDEVDRTGYLLSDQSRKTIACYTWEVAASQTYDVYKKAKLINISAQNNLL